MIFKKHGFEPSREVDLLIMAKYIAEDNADFDLAKFVDNLIHRQFSRWQELILKNSFVDRKGALKDMKAKLANATTKFHTTQTLADKMRLEQTRWKRFCDDLIKQSSHFLSKRMLRQFSLSLKVPLTRLEVILLYEHTINPATMRAEQKSLAKIISDPVNALKADVPPTKPVTAFSLQRT